MNHETLLLELILGGFFATACIRCAVPSTREGRVHLMDLVRLPRRLERLRRSRWQWFSMVALLLVVRLQIGAPVVLEWMVALMFVVFIALPSRSQTPAAIRSR